MKLRTARGRKASSSRWLERQLNDPYVAEARRRGYASRAAFKLIWLDEKYRLLRPGRRILDLGAAPGGWSQVAAQRLGGKGEVIALDKEKMKAPPGVRTIRMDLMADGAAEALIEKLAGPVDVVLSDMASAATGHRQTDRLRTMALCEAAYEFALEVLTPGGDLVCKVLRGGAEGDLLARAKQDFRRVKHAKPPASRSGSSELYLVAIDFRPHAGGAQS